jgi:CRISPR-associated protein (TIGR02584 family)
MITLLSSKALFCVTGLTPQIVTETLYGLCVQQQPAWIPDRVVVLTTTEGKKRILEQLLDKAGGWFDAFCADYGLSGRILFDASCVIVPMEKSGTALGDVRTAADNACMGDAIAHTIHSLTQQYDALHVSIAGGRKTMGYYAGSALSLYGRPQDRMSHVLVNEPFEQAPAFYFPPAVPVPVVLRDGSTMSSSKAQVVLADIPFLRLGGLTAPSLQACPISFESLVAQVQNAVRPIWLNLDLTQYTVHTGAGTLRLEPSAFTVYAWFVMARQRGLGTQGQLLDTHSLYASHYVNFATLLSPNGALSEASLHRLAQEIDGPDFRQYLSQKLSIVRKHLKLALGSAAVIYDVTAHKKHGRGLLTDAALINLPDVLLHYDVTRLPLRRVRND